MNTKEKTMKEIEKWKYSLNIWSLDSILYSREDILYKIASLYHDLGQFDGASKYYEESLKIKKKVHQMIQVY